MRKILTFLLVSLLALLVFPASANAQQETKFAQVSVSLWPEYELSTAQPDQSNVLVLNYLLLDPGVSLPAKITLRIPATAIKPHVVAVGATLGTVTDNGVDYSTAANGDWIDVRVTATGPAIQLEYYDYALQKEGAARQYTYTWPADYEVDDLRIELREPLRSSNVATNPVLNPTATDASGFRYRDISLAKVAAGDQRAFKITYDRDTDAPSTSFLKIEPSAPLENVSGQASFTSYLPWVLGGLGVVLIAGAFFWYWFTSRSGQRPARSRQKRHAAHDDEDDEEDGQRYCSQCGKRAQPSDRFCRACGTRIKRDNA